MALPVLISADEPSFPVTCIAVLSLFLASTDTDPSPVVNVCVCDEHAHKSAKQATQVNVVFCMALLNQTVKLQAVPKETNNLKKGYWMVAYRSISDEAGLQEYSKLAGPIIQANGGKALVRTSDAVEPREAGLKQRAVIVEFESFEKALEVYNSEAYKVALKTLGSSAERDFRIVEGVS